MKSITKLLLAGAVAIAALALAAAPSEAAKKKQAAAKCTAGIDCSICKGKSCEVKRCDADGKLYDNLVSRVCLPPNCPQKC
jgi:hypothetical protein